MIDNEDISRLKEIFVTRQECDGDMSAMSEKISKTDARLAVIEYQQKVNNWLTAAIASGIVALVIKTYFGG
jgi:hypothetical protein